MKPIELAHKPYPRVLCRGWFSSTKVQMSCSGPGYVQEGEPGGEVIPGGQCHLCASLNARASEEAHKRMVRNLKHKKTMPGTADPFQGFRG